MRTAYRLFAMIPRVAAMLEYAREPQGQSKCEGRIPSGWNPALSSGGRLIPYLFVIPVLYLVR